jgi:Protein of unknown function (DUF1552)
MKTISRRTVLRGAGGLVVPLPLLDIMGRSKFAGAQTALDKKGPNGAPKRFVMFFTPCGQGPDWLKSTNTGGKLTFAPALKGLDRHADKILMLDGINNQSALHDAGDIDPGHLKPVLNTTTCMPSMGSFAGGISIDQRIANEIGVGTKIPSLQLGAQASSIGISYKAAKLAVANINDPRQAFTKLFSDFDTSQSALTKINADRKSILDGIKQDYTTLIGRMSGEDKIKLQAHFDSIREVENRLEIAGPSAGCVKPEQPAALTSGVEALIAAGDAHIGLIATALACDMSRVASLIYQGSGGNVQLPGMEKGLHDASHDYGALGWPLRNRYTEWFVGRFATLLDKLTAFKEDGRSILDNTVVFWCSEHGAGNHNYDWMTMMVAGSGGGYFKTGRQISFPNKTNGLEYVQYNAGANNATGPSQADLYVSILNAMGVEASTFGAPAYCKGPLPGLTG